MSLTTTRLLDNYIGGEWTPAQAATGELDVINPATGEVLARVPLSGAADLDAAVRAARAALPEWRAVSTIARARKLFELRERLVARQRGAGAVGDDRDGQDDRRRPRRGGADDRDGRGRVRDPDDDAGPDPGGRLAQHRRRDDPPAGRGVRGDRAVQLPGDGAVLVPAVRDRVREHVRAQAVRAGAADPADRVRGARRARAAAGRGEPRQRRARGGRGDPRASRDRRGVVRRLGAGRADRLRAARRRPASACRRSAARRTTWS